MKKTDKNYLVFNKSEKEVKRLGLQSNLNLVSDLKVFKSCFKKLDKDAIAIDFGCYNGNLTKSRFSSFEGKFKRIIGIDFSPEGIETANQTNKNLKYKFINADVESDDFETLLKNILKEEGKKYFDVAFGSYLMLHLKNPQRFLNTLAKFSNNKTLVIFREPDADAQFCYPNNDLLKTIVNNYSKIRLMSRYSNRFMAREIPGMLIAAGFKNVKAHYSQTDTLGKSLKKRLEMFEISFGYKYNFNYNTTEKFQQIINENRQLLDSLKELFKSENFYHFETRFIFVASK